MSLKDSLEEFNKPLKVLTLDIETSPAIVYAWGIRDQHISVNQIVESSRVLCWAGKWAGSEKVEFWSEHHHSREEMVRAAWVALDEADIVVGYNHISFDIPHLQREFVMAGYAPPSPWQNVDLFHTVRSRFKFMSSSLGFVTDSLGMDTKHDAGGMETWRKVLAGDKAAWSHFKDYNIQDVQVTEALAVYLRAWLKLPHRGLWSGDMSACYACGATKLTIEGINRTKTQAYLRLRCECGSVNRQLSNGETRQA